MFAQRSGTRLSYRGSDPDEVADVLSRCITPVRVHKALNTKFSYGYEFVAAGSTALSRVSCEGELSIGQRNEEPKFLVLLPHAGVATVKVGKQNLISEPGTATILDGTRLSEMRFEERRSHYSFLVGQGEIIHHLSTILERPVDGALDFAPHFDLETGSGRIIFRLAQILANSAGHDAMQDMPQTLSYLSKSLINLLVETVPHRFSEAMSQGEWLPSPRHVKRAVDFMHANLANPLSMAEIAQAAGIGVRSLQDGFKRFKGTTPTNYLAQLRMEAAHRDLMEEDSTMSVSDIARKWGFRHMGRFSSDYRKCYGYPPSQARKGRS